MAKEVLFDEEKLGPGALRQKAALKSGSVRGLCPQAMSSESQQAAGAMESCSLTIPTPEHPTFDQQLTPTLPHHFRPRPNSL